MDSAPPRRVVVLGSTGSVGRQTLDVIRANPDRWTVVGLAAGRDEESLTRQAAEFSVPRTGLGADAAIELAAHPDADIVVNGIVGAAGLRASVAALGSGKVLALANKERRAWRRRVTAAERSCRSIRNTRPSVRFWGAGPATRCAGSSSPRPADPSGIARGLTM